MHKRFISLYYQSIGLRHAFLVLFSILIIPFTKKNSANNKLREIIRKIYGDVSPFIYCSARGALADFLLSLKLKKNDEVMVSGYNCIAVPTAVIAAGLKPIYYDVDCKTMNLTLESVKKALTTNTRVIIVQHTLGSVADIESIKAFASERNIIIIEDCALALGTSRNSKIVGTNGDAAIFSMELSKTLTVGWGGVLIVNNPSLVSNINIRYQNTKEYSLLKRLRMGIQTAVSGIAYKGNIYQIGRFAIALLFKLKLFKISTPEGEYYGKVNNDFISKIGSPQINLAIYQWNNYYKLIKKVNDNGIEIRRILIDNGYSPLGNYNENDLTVSPRVPVLVKDRKELLTYFRQNNVDLGVWFDEPLSPAPKSSIFNYDKNKYSNALYISQNVINFPSHNSLCVEDLNKINSILKEYRNKKYSK